LFTALLAVSSVAEKIKFAILFTYLQQRVFDEAQNLFNINEKITQRSKVF